jgi:murein DD-endopeptidase MepM/ murein hydrolase activator NlpD
MHLMSFYAAPYGVTSDKKHDKKSLNKIIWFASGAILGCAFTFLIATNLNDNDGAVQGDKIAQLLDQHQLAADGAEPTAEQNTILSGDNVAKLNQTVGMVQKPVPTWPLAVDVTIASGDTLIDVLVRQGIDGVAAHRLAKQINSVYNLRRLRPGNALNIILIEDNSRKKDGDYIPTKLQEMQLFISDLETLSIQSNGADKYKVRIMKKKLLSEPARAKAVIVSSFYKTLSHRGLPKKSIDGLIKNFSYEIDFQRDIKYGDLIDVMYENKKTEDGKVVAKGEVIYAMLKSDGKVLKHYRYTDPYGNERFYNENGESIIKRLLKTPVDGARISSGFGMRRHPIMGYSKMHQGVDFAAPTGTPIYAAGDGIVQFAGYNGGYGNIVQIKHNGMYVTAYAHASRIHPSVRRGARIHQGQVIAYVGSTGNSTGAHLHYEIRKYGRQINPLGVQFASATNQLRGSQLASFKEHVRKVHQQLASLKDNSEAEVAMAE